jgi:hypothetical protein
VTAAGAGGLARRTTIEFNERFTACEARIVFAKQAGLMLSWLPLPAYRWKFGPPPSAARGARFAMAIYLRSENSIASSERR